jgi:hypothetical protein
MPDPSTSKRPSSSSRAAAIAEAHITRARAPPMLISVRVDSAPMQHLRTWLSTGSFKNLVECNLEKIVERSTGFRDDLVEKISGQNPLSMEEFVVKNKALFS